MAPLVSIVGKSNIGKTTLLEKVVAELKRRGHRVATVKHDVHGFQLDQPGKDSYRLAQAGSDVVVISSPQQLAMLKRVDHDHTVEEIARLIGNEVDLVLTEGFKRGSAPKIEVHRREVASELLCGASELVAVATDELLPIAVPQFDLDDAAGLADLLEERFLANREPAELEVAVDGRPLGLKPFVREMVANVVVGMLAALRGTENARLIELKILRSAGGKR